MAAGSARGAVVFFGVLFLFFGQHSLTASESRFPNVEQVKGWAEAINTDLVLKMNMLTGWDIFNLSYNKQEGYYNKVEFWPVNESILVENMAAELSKTLSQKMDALWSLVDAAEKAAQNHTYNPYLQKTEYHNAKELRDEDLEYDIHFQQPVNFNYSSVHIPVEIYDGEISILNGLNWSKALDKQFMENYNKDKQMMWQFFGSHTGFMRTYPASKWNMRGSVDLFDVRRQSWYTQGSSSPKDMIILIDKSGSTHGQALQLMKNAVKSILDTLGENDFVNIVAFSQDADFVSKCFNHTAFVQANSRNKRQLEKDVDSLTAGGQAEYKAGLRFAFEKFEEFANSSKANKFNMGANCNKVIILLTDGGTDNAEEVFKEYNWPNKSVRVFTYAIGPTATPVAAIKWMACANRGYFSQIPAMGAIRARVQEYTRFLKQGMEQLGVQPLNWEITADPRYGLEEMEYIPVLSRPQVLKNAKTFEWGNMYKDHLGLGMMTTVTLPVYNRTSESLNQTILGVMGIDVPTTELGKRTPYLEIGPNGYSFAINPNGYAVFHPNLKRTGRYMKDPPNIDLLELELEGAPSVERPELMQLRSSMIEGEKGIIHVADTLFLSPDKKYVSWASVNYAFTNITNTTFRLGLCVPEFQRYYPRFMDNTSIPDFIEFKSRSKADTQRGAFHIAPWEYLGNNSFLNHQLNGTLTSLLELLKGVDSTDLTADDIQLLQTLNTDVSIAVHMEDYFRTLRSNDVSTHFVASNGGLTMVYPESNAYQFKDLLDIRNASYYLRAIYDGADYIIIPVMDSQNDNVSELLVARSSSAFRFDYRAAVLGVRINANKLQDIMLQKVKEKTDKQNSDLKLSGMGHTVLSCDNQSAIVCYLIDDGGFLVASNQDDDEVGKFLGELDSQMWHALQNESVFGRTVQYDFQAMCTVIEDITSAGPRSCHVPSVSAFFDVLSVNWWTSKVTWAFASLNIYDWLFGYNGVFAQVLSDGIDDVAYDDELDLDEEEECVRATQQFYFNKTITSTSGPHEFMVECPECTRKVILVRLDRDVRLTLMVAEPKCAKCPGGDTVVTQDPYRISEREEENLVCNQSMHPRKRVVSYGCYDNDPNEDESKCDASALTHSKLMAVIASVVTSAIVWLLSQDRR